MVQIVMAVEFLMVSSISTNVVLLSSAPMLPLSQLVSILCCLGHIGGLAERRADG